MPILSADTDLPNAPGVYIARDAFELPLYVGQAVNLRQRWKNGHHALLSILRSGGDSLSFRVSETHVHDEHRIIYSLVKQGYSLINSKM